MSETPTVHEAVPQRPNPGSDAALAAGCRCDPFENNGGRWCPYGTDGWVIADGCPVHAPRAA